MATSKITIDGVGIDLTGDTVTAEKLIRGYTAHDANGNPITGTCEEVHYEGVVSYGDGSLGIYSGVTATQQGNTLIIGG